ncbi:MAG: hypothetical protein AAF431_07265 [Pseudomonadota bacterium]
MLNQLFPKVIDNHFHGHYLALWLFALITLSKVCLGLITVFYAEGSAQPAAQVLLASDSSPADTAMQSVFAHLGLAQLSLGLLFAVVLLRYRSMIPLMYSLLLVEYLLEDGVAGMQPLLVTITPAAADIALILTLMGITGFVLSLRDESGLIANH